MYPDTLVALTGTMPMWFAPGTKRQYDSSGYVCLARLVEGTFRRGSRNRNVSALLLIPTLDV